MSNLQFSEAAISELAAKIAKLASSQIQQQELFRRLLTIHSEKERQTLLRCIEREIETAVTGLLSNV